MNRVVAIVGPFRSGTSLVAQVVHRLGFPIGMAIPAPIPPSWRSDWEDPELTFPLMQKQARGRAWFEKYLSYRRQLSSALGFGGRVAVKSPYLALHWADFCAAADPFVIECTRDGQARGRSLQAHPQLSVEDDERIVETLASISPDVVSSYEEACAAPAAFVRALADELEVRDDGAVRAAIALVGRPTTYTT